MLFVDFSKAFDFIHRGKMEQILLAYGLPKETVAAIMMLYKKVRSPDRDTDYFDIVAGVLQGDTLAPFLFIIRLDLCIIKLATVVEGDQKAPFSIATTPRCREGRYSFPWIAPLYPWYVPCIAEC